MQKKTDMLNKRPIIVNGFARGGTNILMNLLLSHPDIAMPSGELDKVLHGSRKDPFWRKWEKRWRYERPLRKEMGDAFSLTNLNERMPMSSEAQILLDKTLFEEKIRARHPQHNYWKSEGVPYTDQERETARLVVKAHHGLIFLNPLFRDLYPDVRFVCVLRNGYALCESLKRRRHSIEWSANLVDRIGREMLKNNQLNDFHLVKFEDIIQDPLKEAEGIYEHIEEDIGKINKFRLQDKRVPVGRSGSSLHGKKDRAVIWYDRDELSKHFKTGVNSTQIKRLNTDEIELIESIAGETIEKLGYPAPI